MKNKKPKKSFKELEFGVARVRKSLFMEIKSRVESPLNSLAVSVSIYRNNTGTKKMVQRAGWEAGAYLLESRHHQKATSLSPGHSIIDVGKA